MHIPPKEYGQIMFGYGVSFLVSAILAIRLSKRINMARLLQVGGVALLIGGLILMSSVHKNEIDLLHLSIGVVICVAGISFVVPSAITFAMTEFAAQAGSASACLGVMQFAIAALFGAIISMSHEQGIFLIGLLAATTGFLALYSKCKRKKMMRLGADVFED